MLTNIVAFNYVDTPMCLVGLLSFFTCCFFMIVRFNWKEERLEENVDDEQEEDDKGGNKKIEVENTRRTSFTSKLRKSLLK